MSLLEKIQENYENFIPSKKKAEILLTLYQEKQNYNEVFTYDELKFIIKETYNKSFETDRNEAVNDIIRKWIDIFIKRTEDGYKLTTYAETFCGFLLDTVNKIFTATQIRKDFEHLYDYLKKCKSKNEVIYWIREFSNYKIIISRQIDNLKIQVGGSLNEFRKTINSETETGWEWLKNIDDKLSEIKKQVDELEFATSKSIRIQQELHAIDNFENIHSYDIVNIHNFFDEIKYDFKVIHRKIEHIQPKLQQFYKKLKYNDFDKKTEQFFNYLLNNCIIKKKEISLPENIKLKPILNRKNKFIQILKKEYRVRTNLQPYIHEYDKNTHDEQFEKCELLFQNNETVKKWTDFFKKHLKENTLIFEDWFYKILEEENNNIYIPIKIAYNLITEYSNNEEFKIGINENQTTNKNYNDVSIWKMKISKKNTFF